MFNKYKNGSLVLVNGIGEFSNKLYKNQIAKIICRDPFFKDYNVIFEDGSEDWIKPEDLSSLEGSKN